MTGRKRKLHEPPTCINDLPNCQLVEIFLRLPLITSHRLKIVCKRWYSIISEPHFADCFSQDGKLSWSFFTYFDRIECECIHYFDYGSNSSSTYSYHLDAEFSLDYITSEKIKSDITVEACSNDLLLCGRITRWDDFLVCNPITREISAHLPSVPKVLPEHTMRYKRCIGFISKKSGGFAIVVIKYCAMGPAFIWILSSNAPAWVELEIPCPPRIKNYWFSTKNCVGVPYKGHLFFYERRNKLIIGIDPFNVSAKNPWLFIDPPTRNTKCSREYLRVCRKNLRFCQISEETRGGDPILRVWDLKDPGEWILHRHVLLQDVVRKYRFHARIHVQACHPNDPDIIYLSSRLKDAYEISLSFHMSTCEARRLNAALIPGWFSYIGVVPYTIQWQPTPLASFKELSPIKD